MLPTIPTLISWENFSGNTALFLGLFNFQIVTFLGYLTSYSFLATAISWIAIKFLSFHWEIKCNLSHVHFQFLHIRFCVTASLREKQIEMQCHLVGVNIVLIWSKFEVNFSPLCILGNGHFILMGRNKILYGPSLNCSPVRARGAKSRMCPPYPQRDRKRRLNGAVCRNHRIKRVVPCRCLDGHVKEPYEMSMALGARP